MVLDFTVKTTRRRQRRKAWVIRLTIALVAIVTILELCLLIKVGVL